MKSGLAAMVVAVERLLASGKPRGTLAFLITSDEEGSALHGTRHVVEVLKARGITPDFAIVGEATAAEVLGDRITIGRRGSLGCNLRVLGKQRSEERRVGKGCVSKFRSRWAPEH